MLGRNSLEILGKKLPQVVSQPATAAAPPAVGASAERQDTNHKQELYWRKDGSSFPVEYTSTPILAADNSINGQVVIFRDITARKRTEENLREKEAQYRSIFNTTTDGMLVLDSDENIIEVNERAGVMYGYSPEEFIALSGQDLFLSQYQQTFSQFLRDRLQT